MTSSILRCAVAQPDSLGLAIHSWSSLPKARTALVAALALTLACALSGCGSGQPQSTLLVHPTSTGTTPDRLAAPTLPPNPRQADVGAQTYWAHCMACHGDRGQGLTAEFRELYPPEDRNCWESGCHGPRPYENGFTLPAAVPPLVGGGLEKWSSAAGLQAFIAAAMPFSSPGSLTEEESWQVTAFLLRQNGWDPGTEVLGPENAAEFLLSPDANRSPTPPSSASAPTPAPESQPVGPRNAPGLVMAAALLLMIAWWLRFERRRRGGSNKE